jgi:ABC-type dipeptide/oligopeptide/nickel transport system permease subunit
MPSRSRRWRWPPWLLAAGRAVVILVILAFNFLGDGLRDAARPRTA